ncbi:NAD(P)H oxidoreductase [Polaribacter reichenbachii]|uniref:NAD(P)H oxidoreductase n=1 Tax=Polaribacter reichenbachii TaxID=996801 RepID=A0A1B8U4C7_9FLAO|nr:NAD(P)H-dependent oxidoreductase [Polaribacter reichenbachii]APZ47467.1 NAD(P)H oxidoreductase [Polaribacter reichenbachii]AUC18106.1 NAD(P)H oxidoreductase [Polaribacter reichenbachii]OBY66717.1 NAD(P)H oxidoreductase [Polaribacter reichenbachii]
MKKILVLFAHPKYEKSKVNTALIEHIRGKQNVTIHDLYEQYHDFHIDVKAEKELLQQHDIIIWHHPFYWYSCPPLLKQWIDMVLEFNWAYGPEGKALEGKICLNAITTGASKAMYCSAGINSFTVRQFLRPFEQTANLCNMTYFPPFAVMGTHRLTDDILEQSKIKYGKAIDLLQSNVTLDDFDQVSFLNDVSQLNTI